RSWAVARMALPQLVRVTNRWSASMSGIVTPITRRSFVVMKSFELNPNHSYRISTEGKISGYDTGAGTTQRSALFSDMNDTPQAVMTGVTRGGVRRVGR